MHKQGIKRAKDVFENIIIRTIGLILAIIYSSGMLISTFAMTFVFPWAFVDMIRTAFPIERPLSIWFIDFHWAEIPILLGYLYYFQWIFRKAIWPMTSGTFIGFFLGK